MVSQIANGHGMKGGTYAIGETRACLNVTYNYGPIFRRILDSEKGLRVLYGMTGEQSIPILEAAIDLLGDNCDPDYWKPTEGNVKQALCHLLKLARLCREGVWQGD